MILKVERDNKNTYKSICNLSWPFI